MRRSTTESLIKALIQLLREDEDRFVIVREKLIEIGAPARPALREAVTEGDPLISKRAAEVLEAIGLEEMDQAWRAYAQKEPRSLEEGVFLLARFHTPETPLDPHRRRLDQMAQALRERIGVERDPQRVIQAINHYLFHELRFSGNRLQYYLPENSYIHTLLDRERGIPISLSALFLCLAEKLRLPLYGVGLPGHFLVQWSDAQHEIYIDPFNQGQTLTREEIAANLAKGGMVLHQEHLQKVGARQILARMMRNLIDIYTQEEEMEKAKWLGRFEDRLRPSRNK